MNTKQKLNPEWFNIASYLENNRPQYGNVLLELTYHQSSIKKVKLLHKEEIVLFEKKKLNLGEKI